MERIITFLAIGPGTWGRGVTLDGAVRNAQEQGYRLTDPILIYVSDDPEIRLDGDGSIVYHPPLGYTEIYRNKRGWRYGKVE